MASKEKNIDIEFLRAAALLMILFQHAEVLVSGSHQLYWNIREHLNLWGSVDLFFCVSGFIITRGLIQTYPPGPGEERYLISRRLGWKHTAFAFWVRRAWRLWPAAWLWIVLSLACALWLNRSGVFGDFGRMARDGLAAFVHLANFHWAGCYLQDLATCNMMPATRFEAHLPTGWNLAVYWSLSLEEQFYFLVPLVLFFLPKRWVAAAIGLSLVGLGLLSRDPMGVLWFVRVDAILVGVALGWYTHERDRRAVPSGPPAWLRHRWLIHLLTIALLLAIGWLGAGDRGGRSGTITAIALCSGALVWIASFDRDALVPSQALARAFFVWVGKRSYCIYLVHMVVFFVTIELWYRAGGVHTTWQWVAFFVTPVVMLPLLAEATARWVETPLRRHGHERAKVWLLPPAPATAVKP